MFLQQNSVQHHSITYSIMLTKHAENYLNLGYKLINSKFLHIEKILHISPQYVGFLHIKGTGYFHSASQSKEG